MSVQHYVGIRDFDNAEVRAWYTASTKVQAEHDMLLRPMSRLSMHRGRTV